MLTFRELKYLIHDVLFEGVEQDRQSLIELYPTHKNELMHLGHKWIMWLMMRFGVSKSVSEVHPFEDALATVKSYSQRDAAISQKYNSSEQWRQAVDQAFPNKKWKNPTDVMTMTADDMETLLAMSQRKKQNADVNQASNVENDRIGKVGSWNLWMPSTRENSCQIAGYDPATMKPYTTWCTARTAGSNLFYNYVGREGTILFYLIKDDAKKPSDRLSVGFVDGKPVLSGEHGDVSVDGVNAGLTQQRLRTLLKGHYDQIMSTLQDVADKHKGNHPAIKKIAEATHSVVALKNLIKGLSKDVAGSILNMIVDKPISSDVAEYLYQLNIFDVNLGLSANEHAPVEILTQIAKQYIYGDKPTTASSISANLASNISTPAEILSHLANHKYSYIRQTAAKNSRTPIDALVQLASDHDDYVRVHVADNPNTPRDTLLYLLNDKEFDVRWRGPKNPNLTSDVLITLADHNSSVIRRYVTFNPNVTSEILSKLADDDDQYVRACVAQNKKTPIEKLRQLSNDVFDDAADNAAETLSIVLGENKVYERVLRKLKTFA